MNNKRLTACFDVIHGRVTKAQQFFDNIDVMDVSAAARRFCEMKIDKIIFFDVTASAEKRRIDLDMVKKAAKEITVPLIVGGGIRDLSDMEAIFAAGAEKISIDSMAVRNPELIAESAKKFGSKRIVLSMQVKKVPATDAVPTGYEIAIDGARVFTGMDAVVWAKRGEELGAGEICVNSIDNDGMSRGYDLPLTHMVCQAVKVPVIASGGAGCPAHLYDVFTSTDAAAGIISSMLYSPRLPRNYGVQEIKDYLRERGVPVF